MNKKILFIPLIAFMILAGVFATQLVRNQSGDDPTKLESVLIGKGYIVLNPYCNNKYTWSFKLVYMLL